jgi:hypothetical protein
MEVLLWYTESNMYKWKTEGLYGVSSGVQSLA